MFFKILPLKNSKGGKIENNCLAGIAEAMKLILIWVWNLVRNFDLWDPLRKCIPKFNLKGVN